MLVCLVLAPAWAAAPQRAWVLFVDKPDGHGGRISWVADGRQASGHELDLPVDPDYVERVTRQGVRLRFTSRWLNGVSGEGTALQLRALGRQSFVRAVRPVQAFGRPQPTQPLPLEPAAGKSVLLPEYGHSFEQLAQIGIVPLQALGYDGSGIRVALLDNGFHYRAHPALRGVQVIAERDFVNGDDDVTDQAGQPVTGDETRSDQNVHGAQVLSLLAGNDPGYFMGAAPAAGYILAKTEDNRAELPIEEDRWVAGLEWAADLGAQVVNTSLGYNYFDDGSGYTYEDMDGQTAVTTVAGELAVSKGIVVVAAAGNEGLAAWRYVTAPADGRDVIAVGSVGIPAEPGQLPVIAATSSRGPTSDGRIKPDVVAPGEGVVVADVRGNGYVRNGGTSFAAPLVAGACVLLRQAHPDWGPGDVLEALRRTATDLGDPGPDTTYGWGQVDALGASGLQVSRPEKTLVGHPYPNPVTGDTVHFPLQVVEQEDVTLSLFDVSGQLVHQQTQRLLPGVYALPQAALQWDLARFEADRGAKLANGVLIFYVRTPAAARTGKIALVRPRR
ncbi:MAG: S8 family peptidase [Candidatus Latescibacterota bacterium]